jgi:stage III sporulation protein AD
VTELVVKAAVLACAGTLAALVIKRGSPELSSVLAMAVCAGCMYIAAELLRPLAAELEHAAELSGLSPAMLAPVLKCVGLGIAAKLAAGLCRDGGQAAMASAVELVGAAGALCAALPLVSALLSTLKELV